MRLLREMALTLIVLALLCNACLASEGFPWWLARNAGTPTNGYITVITPQAANINTSVLEFQGNGVVATVVQGPTTTVTITSGSTPPSVGIWGLGADLELTPLPFPLTFTSGLWRVTMDNTVAPSYTDWFDSLWTTNIYNDLTPR